MKGEPAPAPAPARGALRFGFGPQPALLLHCSLARAGAWRGLMAGLADRWSATAPDLPGHGTAPDWDGATDLGEAALRRALAHLAATPADVAGHSFGAVVALRLALDHPGRLNRLILFEPVLFAAARADAAPAHAAQAVAMAGIMAALATGDRAAALVRFLADWGGVPAAALPDHQRRYMEARIHLISAGAPTLEHDIRGLLAPGRLEALALPVLLVEGAASPPVIAAIGDHLARRIPGLVRVTIPGAGHMLPVTHAAAAAAAVRAFLDDRAG